MRARAGKQAGLAVVLSLALTGCAMATPAVGDSQPRVILETGQGRIVVSLALDAAPMTVCNFLVYVTDGDYDGGAVFRTVVSETNANPNPIDVIQAASKRGVDDNLRPPIPLERTRDTGLTHSAGAISMARDGPDTATSSFFIVTRDTPSLDFGGGRNPDGQGFAAFGHVVEGLDVARRIQLSPANSEEQLTPPVVIVSARLDGPVPTSCRP